MLNRVLGRSGESGIGELGGIEEEVPDWSYEQVWPAAKENHPELKRSERMIELSRSELKFAQADLLPDLMVRGMYKDMADTADDFWSLMLGVSVPVAPWSARNYANKVKESELELGKAQSGYTAAENMAAAEIRSALAKIAAEKKLIAIYENTLVPQVQQTLGATLAAYRAGKTELLMALDAYRMRLRVEEDRETAVKEYMMGQAELEKAVGMDLAELRQRLAGAGRERTP